LEQGLKHILVKPASNNFNNAGFCAVKNSFRDSSAKLFSFAVERRFVGYNRARTQLWGIFFLDGDTVGGWEWLI